MSSHGRNYLLNWKKKISIGPSPLPEHLKELIALAYCAFANEITGREWFNNIPAMREILEEIIK